MTEIPTTFEWVVTVRNFARCTAVCNGQEPFSYSGCHTSCICNRLHSLNELVFDEVEPAIPIGTRANIHKIGCLFWSFKSLPSWMNEDSRLTQVAVNAASLDLKTYGFDPILTEFSRDIRLETCEGFKISSGRQISVRGCKLTFVADNLAYHSVIGCTEKFSSCDFAEIVSQNQRTSNFFAEKLFLHSGIHTKVP